MIKMQFVIFSVYPAKLREVFSLLFNQETVILGRVQNRLFDPHDMCLEVRFMNLFRCLLFRNSSPTVHQKENWIKPTKRQTIVLLL